MAHVTNITSKADFDALTQKHAHVALQAHASWCAPCRAMIPIFNKQTGDALAVSTGDNLAFARFDTDEVPDLASELGIRSIPAFFFFDGGVKSESLVGANPSALKTSIEKMTEAATTTPASA
ncbi:thioredoxin 1 [Geosmithia morbida]|uniref:Thioredoxin 1 n=1 Tax=Geosmithia morbida TaxID=1094350 RepID=A0A9P5CXZ4_9HYPO|nr:thioredoxin 1 [Geosmithia morbida]KAF4119823.1 thioredoxin 1 [Geosmithia morbida]